MGSPYEAINESIYGENNHNIPTTTVANNNGGDTDYYRINPSWQMLQDVIEDREMNFAQANILKAAFAFNKGRHDASTYERELNKIIWFANRELCRILKK